MKPFHWVLGAINLALLLGFGAMYAVRLNYEFIIYVAVILFFLCLIAISLRRIEYTPAALISLTIWSAMHLAGGAVPVGAERLYDAILIPLSTTYPVLRYDQLVHIWGFGSATLVMYCLLRPSLREQARNNLISLSIVVGMAGLGVGAFNEIVEFVITVVTPESGVGGYLNTALDLCSDLVGVTWAILYIHLRYGTLSVHTVKK
ncbi:MAG: DUF2238 domain-containing protein [Sedimentisphaerales bacterium]|nr:DUF2238 domain-containing protein [Sedimentisphaerales bacterium]